MIVEEKRSYLMIRCGECEVQIAISEWKRGKMREEKNFDYRKKER